MAAPGRTDSSAHGFYAEVAERGAYADGAAFGREIARGRLENELQGRNQRQWRVAYARDGRSLGLEVNQRRWVLERRWNQDGRLGLPMLESPIARQDDNGKVVAGGAILRCGSAPAWLYANPDAETWLARYHGDAARLRLELPAGAVHVPAMGTGIVTWEKGRVTVDAVDLEGPVAVEGGVLVP